MAGYSCNDPKTHYRIVAFRYFAVADAFTNPLINFIHALIFFIELHKRIIFFIQKHIHNHFSISVISYSYTSIHSFLYFHLLCFYDFYNVKLTYLSVIIEYMQIPFQKKTFI